jgi:predicted XRE-type DNA-binding protein
MLILVDHGTPRGIASYLPEHTVKDVAMKREKLKVVRGSGNVFRDLGRKNADAEQCKAVLAAEIIKALDREGPRGARATGIAAADLSRIRNADLGRFTVDRLMSIINRLGSRVEVNVRVRRADPLMDDPSAWLTELKNIPADPDFMKKRLQPKTPKRAIFRSIMTGPNS